MISSRRRLAVALSAVALAVAPRLAQAQEGSGCGGFKWPLEPERAALVRADKPSLANGGAIAFNLATTLELRPLAGAGLPKAPERAPKSAQGFAGHFILAEPAKPGDLQDHDLVAGLDRRARRRRLLASESVHRRDGMRGRAQEREVRSAVPQSCGAVQRRRGRPDFGHRLARPIRPPASRRGRGSPSQWRKCRSPVNTIAAPASSAAAITSASRTDPPG